MEVLEKINIILGEAKKTGSTKMECMECGKKFKKKIGPRTYEVKCPKCGSYDTEPI
jgi:DNA-directed RNA polymerase subunit RPC12/RpoP